VVAIVRNHTRPAVSISPLLAEFTLMLLVAVAVLVLRLLSALPPDLILPLWLIGPSVPPDTGSLAPGAPDLWRASLA